MAARNGTKLKVDKSGRIVVPKRIRDGLGMRPDAELEITPQSGGLFVRVVNEESALIKIDGIWVHRGSLMPGANWDRAVEDVREERIASIFKSDR